MSKYIESEYLENIVDYYLGHSNGAEHYAYGVMRGEVRIAPAADVVEVVHGHWELIPNHDVLGFCSVCKYKPAFVSYKYCPNCGSKMDQVIE